MDMPPPPSSSPSSSVLADMLRRWQISCVEQPQTQEDLRAESRTCFRRLVQEWFVSAEENGLSAAKLPHEEALAKVIQELGPAFSLNRHASRNCALQVIVGALEGCSESQLSNSVANLLGTFLLTHCGPLEEDESGEDFDDQIRDAAVMAMAALSQITTVTATNGSDVIEAITIRLKFAQEGVRYRCASPEMDDDENRNRNTHGFGQGRSANDIRGELSNLPRSKRSLCFDLLQSATTGVGKIVVAHQSLVTKELLSDIQPKMIAFVVFAANCMHGESDPRCLQQLLQLLHSIQRAFQPMFIFSKDSSCVFPTSEIFDAVAPYYPIQFTPPPNNVHGITRSGLHSSLVSVLTFGGADAMAKQHNRHTMVNLSAGLFIEQLLPPEEEDDKPNVAEQLEVIECLTTLLFPPEVEGANSSRCDQLEIDTARDLCVALITIHDKSSLNVSQGGAVGSQNKQLADSCRTLVSKIAFQLEFATKKELWETFVMTPLSKLAARVKLSPARGRTAIAYGACLAASGGPRTLRCCLTSCLGILIDVVSQSLDDFDNAAAAAYGVGAFFSSCRVAMDRAKKEGVVLSPHPLESYTGNAFQALYNAFTSLKSEKELVASKAILVKIGSVRALESVLLAGTAKQFQPDDATKICQFVQELLDSVLDDKAGSDDDEWRKACYLTLGSLLGTALEGAGSPDEIHTGDSAGILTTEIIRDFFTDSVYPKVLESATKSLDIAEKSRFDWEVLSMACICGRASARFVITSLLDALNKKIQQGLDDSCLSYAEALSFVLRHGGDVATQAYHGISTPDAIFKKVSTLSAHAMEDSLKLRTSIQNLALPATVEEREAQKTSVSIVRLV